MQIKTQKVILFLGLILLSCFTALGQDRFAQIETDLQQKAKTLKGLNNPVTISVNHSPLQEIIRAIAIENQLNVSVDVTINEQPSYNFAGATVAEVFLFLCKEHNLYLDYTGNIIAFKRFETPKAKPDPIVPKELNVNYEKGSGLINADLRNDTLYNVFRKLSQLTKINVQLDASLHKELVTMTVVNQQVESVIKRLAGENELIKVSEDFYLIKKVEPEATAGVSSSGRGRSSRGTTRNSRGGGNRRDGANEDIVVERNDSLMTLSAVNAPLKDIVETLSIEADVNFFLFKEPKGNLTVHIVNASYEAILEYVLNTTDFTYKVVEDIYIIGERKDETLRQTIVHPMQYRTVDDLANIIPSEIKKNVEVKEFNELNSFVLSGAQLQINEIVKFLNQIDKVVPVVLIEIMIVDINKSHSISTGLKIGRDGSISSGASLDGAPSGLVTTLDADLLNQIVSAISNLGFFNLGAVGEGFYVQMSNLEENGYLSLHSTPKLATLNGHEAKLTIGETVYYPIDQTNVIGAQSPQVVQTRTYNSVNADLAVTIKPMVSGDDQITLEVTVSQSTFGAQEGQAPPGIKKREFQSLIRMKNQEMVILGGLEQDTKQKSGSGVPFLARIPVIKWFFSNTYNKKDDAQLTIFIRPTVIY